MPYAEIVCVAEGSLGKELVEMIDKNGPKAALNYLKEYEPNEDELLEADFRYSPGSNATERVEKHLIRAKARMGDDSLCQDGDYYLVYCTYWQNFYLLKKVNKELPRR